MRREDGKLIGSKSRLGEDAFPSLREKQEKIMKDVERILKKTIKRSQRTG
ncbi:hypothetical protein [Paenibacillus agricola]|uniref:Uncharacterized protein n=1 Tax=Paenibacillus agricola TaxID=2716264 RepID=A0ABX0JC38_9BACL|nr:hypothetical protein [Paenibacillus agricola]NHN33336.1 hypothetical protein [Paenibacillus agricola]